MFKSFKHETVNRLRSALASVLVVAFLFAHNFVQTANAQNSTAAGVVVALSDNLPVPGVNVVVKGTTNGTITDFDGKFSFQAPVGSTLVFSFIGFESQEVVFNGQPLNVVLTEEMSDLDEVVVVGYGVQKKKLVTGATVQVKGDDIQKLNTTNPLAAMQGQTPGVNIVSTSGQPGASMSVTIRGLGTIGNAQPLYLIDGVGGDISTLNPADIESIDVLKDAASAAIYGAQAANGVVLVTTKKGKEGTSKITYDGYVGVQSVARKFETLNAQEYMTIMDEAMLNSGMSPANWASMSTIYDAEGNVYDTNWIDEAIEDGALTQSHNIAFTGGSKTSTYAVSGGYTAQDGVIGGSDVSYYKRYNFRVNSEHKMFDELITIGEHVGFVYKDSRGMNTGNIWNNNLRAAFATAPIHPIFDAEGNFNSTIGDSWNPNAGNPYGTMKMNRYNQSRNASIDANFYFQVEPIENLRFKTTLGMSYGASDYRSYTPVYKFTPQSGNADTKVTQSYGSGMGLTWINTLSYDFNVSDHSFTTLIGAELGTYDGGSAGGSNSSLIAGFRDWKHAYLNNTEGTTSKSVNGAPYDSTRGMSYFARLGWSWNDRYMVNATMRADGSSKFAEGNRWGYFPSVSAGWTISEEDFMADVKSWLDYLKVRASWGQVGNANINCYQYLAPVSTSNTNYNFGATGGQEGWQTGSYTERLSNEKVKWETSEQTNIGIDARFLDSRLGLVADYYIKTTKDWLVQAPVLATAGTNGPIINGGDVKNTGIELGLTWNDGIGKDFTYSVGANFAYNKNEVGKIPTEDGIIHGQTNQIFSNSEEFYRASDGHAIGYFWGYATAGIFQSQQDIDNWVLAGNGILQTDVRPGDVKYVDINHDGLINNDDKIDLGNGLPKYTFGLNLSLNYKGFDLSMNATGAAGFKIAQSYRDPNDKQANYSRAILERWTGEGTSNRMPRVTYGDAGNWMFSDLYLQDGDYIRLQSLVLGYDFKSLISWKGLSKLRLYAQAQNLLTFTKYDGMDPEVGSYNGTDGNNSHSWVSGVDMGYYPHPRTFIVGLNLGF